MSDTRLYAVWPNPRLSSWSQRSQNIAVHLESESDWVSGMIGDVVIKSSVYLSDSDVMKFEVCKQQFLGVV